MKKIITTHLLEITNYLGFLGLFYVAIFDLSNRATITLIINRVTIISRTKDNLTKQE